MSGLASGVTALAAGYSSHTCALLEVQRPKCWGSDGSGQLGLGTITQQLVPVDVVASAARLRLNYATGQPGSYFTLTGENFPARAQATLTVNGVILTNSLAVNELGQFILFLSTAGAHTGSYQITVSATVSATTAVTLDAASPLRSQEGGGLTLAIGPVSTMLYLPLLQR